MRLNLSRLYAANAALGVFSNVSISASACLPPFQPSMTAARSLRHETLRLKFLVHFTLMPGNLRSKSISFLNTFFLSLNIILPCNGTSYCCVPDHERSRCSISFAAPALIASRLAIFEIRACISADGAAPSNHIKRSDVPCLADSLGTYRPHADYNLFGQVHLGHNPSLIPTVPAIRKCGYMIDSPSRRHSQVLAQSSSVINGHNGCISFSNESKNRAKLAS